MRGLAEEGGLEYRAVGTGGDDLVQAAGVRHEAEFGAQAPGVEGGGAQQAQLLAPGVEQLDVAMARLGCLEVAAGLQGGGDGGLVVGAQDGGAVADEVAVLQPRPDAPPGLHRVGVGGDEHGRQRRVGGGEHGQEVAGAVATGAVVLTRRPSASQLAREPADEGGLLPGGRIDAHEVEELAQQALGVDGSGHGIVLPRQRCWSRRPPILACD